VREANANLAQPHVMNEVGEKLAVEQEKGDNLAAGGFLYASAKDMLAYIRLLLNDGIHQEDTLLQSEVLNELFTPQVIFPLGGPLHNEFTSYGFGWWLTPKFGHKIITHSGGIDGMSANLVMVDDLDFGLIILSNTSREPATTLLTYRVLEELMEESDLHLDYERIKTYRDNSRQQMRQLPEQLEQDRIKDTRPSLALSDYTGTYADKMYGDIEITRLSDQALEINFSRSPIFSGKLTHWHHDTFRIDWYDIRVPDGFLTFNFNARQEVIGFGLDQRNLLDVDFSELKFKKVRK
jgi:hypothetical protein